MSQDRMCRQRDCGGQMIVTKEEKGPHGTWLTLRCRKCGWEVKE